MRTSLGTPLAQILTNQEYALLSHIPADVMHARIAWDCCCWWKGAGSSEEGVDLLLSSSARASWRRVSLFLMRGTKGRDFTDELTNAEASCSLTTVLSRYVTPFPCCFLNCGIFGEKTLGKNKRLCAKQGGTQKVGNLQSEVRVFFSCVHVVQDKLLKASSQWERI